MQQQLLQSLDVLREGGRHQEGLVDVRQVADGKVKLETFQVIFVIIVLVANTSSANSHHSRFFRSASKPKEKTRSASSTTSISRDVCRTRF